MRFLCFLIQVVGVISTDTPTISPSKTAVIVTNEPSTPPPSTLPTILPPSTKHTSSAPSQQPTNSPPPSSAPSQQPTNSHYPSSALSQQPTNSPRPSSAPSQQPTNSHHQSKQPSFSPTINERTPTQSPSFSNQPSTSPSNEPSISPSSPPSKDNEQPTSPPAKPTPTPTTAPATALSNPRTIPEITLTLSGVRPLDPEGEQLFQDITALHIENFYNTDKASSRKSDFQLALFDVQVDIVVLRMNPPYLGIVDVTVDEKEKNVEDGGNGRERAPAVGADVVDGNKSAPNVVEDVADEKEMEDIDGQKVVIDDTVDNTDGDDSVRDRMRMLVVRTTPQRQEPHRRYLRISRRNQEAGVLAITYTQTISYRVRNNANIDLLDVDSIVNSIATEPFNNISKRG
eukprot:CAMPEP_0198257012 /NCGR_PEP_ID=MMETSP1447-20131203/6791_1 /TAXON_ID=420782 /ORGANISM="Chaetoceros dichaeta, Strain CCMP1751" /LENGTH=399 /DNA_ID=CAMNT_0043943801 /DNA_START=118 /DNA_END=1313 /DNA_ORIENTATION=+